MAKDIKFKNTGASFTCVVKDNEYPIKLAMNGMFSVYNVLAALTTALALGFDIEKSIQIMESISGVAGRFEMIKAEPVVIVDYAHTPDGLKNVLQTCREMVINKKLFCVFGCGGNREKEKRAIMGRIASSMADFTIITSDNPRFEKREDIAHDIECGFENQNYVIELDRAKAIKLAIDSAECGDVILIAGKGAENYIDENGAKIPYCDLDEVKKYRR
jgi:UDP-N-acetylmuramoyl-L-alanyl-D-glutamate--2,6-diaminopimelate ligase